MWATVAEDFVTFSLGHEGSGYDIHPLGNVIGGQ